MAVLWKFVTDFGDSAITVPLALLMAAFLAAAREWRLAIGWCLAILGCGATIGGLKLAFLPCGAPVMGPVLTSPSGHTAMSIAVYGGFAAILGARLGWTARTALVAGAALLALCIAVSRIVLHDHSPIEVVAGSVVGGATLAVVVIAVVRYPPSALPIRALGLTTAVVVLLLHGQRWPAERAVHRLAGWFELWRPWCG